MTNDLYRAIDMTALCYAVLIRAIFDASPKLKRSRADDNLKQIRREARAWLYNTIGDDKPTPWTFAWICEHLDLSPAELRAKLPSIIAILPEEMPPSHFVIGEFRKFVA